MSIDASGLYNCILLDVKSQLTDTLCATRKAVLPLSRV